MLIFANPILGGFPSVKQGFNRSGQNKNFRFARLLQK
jgi:hypothetical protein